MKVDIDFERYAVKNITCFELLRDLEYVLRAATGNDRIILFDLGDNVIIDRNDGVAQIANVKGLSALQMAAEILDTALHGQFFGFVHEKEGNHHED